MALTSSKRSRITFSLSFEKQIESPSKRRTWTDASQCERLQTHRRVLTVCGVTLRKNQDPEHWTRGCRCRRGAVTVMEQTGEAGNSRPWTEDKADWLVSVWRAELQDTNHNKVQWRRTGRLRSDGPVTWVNNVALF